MKYLIRSHTVITGAVSVLFTAINIWYGVKLAYYSAKINKNDLSFKQNMIVNVTTNSILSILKGVLLGVLYPISIPLLIINSKLGNNYPFLCICYTVPQKIGDTLSFRQIYHQYILHKPI